MEPKIGFIGVVSATQSESPRVAASFALARVPSTPASMQDLGREKSSSSATSYWQHHESSSPQSLRVVHDELSEKEAKMQWIKKSNLRHQRMVVYMRSVHHDHVFHGVFDHVFVDKKWFCITGKNMNCSPKILILTTIAQPRFDSEKVLPAIRAKWPAEDANKPIFIQ
ncbi:unnamed protein product [Urochloa humidicola]